MKRIIAIALCLGLASSLTAFAKPKDKGEKKQRHAERKIAKVEAKVAKAQNRSLRVSPVLDARVNARIGRNRIERHIERRGPTGHSWSYDEARRHHRREHRDRNWYRSTYSRFALFGGGYYYWDRGYWYPAYGYDPAYSTYRFDEPIYGYGSLEPGQVLVNVQRELRRHGYYYGAIDGLIGPQTRAALARFQRDNGLYVTRAIDGPTLAALGLT